jgi:hypothetical protein
VITFLLAAIVTCTGIDDTATIQRSLADDDVTALSGECAINGATGVRIPAERILTAYSATIRLAGVCGTGKCKLVEVIPGSTDVSIRGGIWVGDGTPAVGWQIGLRIDSGHRVTVEGSTFRNFRTDGIWIGGNTPSTEVLISGVTVEEFGRNGISVTNAVGVTIERSSINGAWPSADPGAGVDVEPNPGESVHDLTIIDTEANHNAVGFFLQYGKGDKQGSNFNVINCRLKDNRKDGLVLNSVVKAHISGNLIVGPAIGVSIGSHTDPIRACAVVFANNQVTAPRPLILAGVKDSYIGWNSLGPGKIEAPALGTAGDMMFWRNTVGN